MDILLSYLRTHAKPISFKGELNAKTNLFLFESIGIVD